MKNTARLPRLTLYITLLISLVTFVCAPGLMRESVSAAPMKKATNVDLSLTMNVDDATPNKNQNIVFTITVSNSIGSAPATGVTVNDLLPVDLVWQSDDGGGAYSAGVWTVGALANGSSATLHITAKNTTSAPKTNSASATAVETEDNPGDNNASQLITPNVADLSLTKTVNDPIKNVGSNVIFTIKVTNSGPDIATGVTVKDILPSGLEYKSDDGGGTFDDSTGIWAAGSLNVGETAQLKITAKVIATGAQINLAEVWSSDQFDPNSTPGNSSTLEDDDATVAVNAPQVDLEIQKVVIGGEHQNKENIVFSITVINHGTSAATGVTLKDLLPAGLNWKSDDGGGAYNHVTGIWAVGNLTASGAGSSDTLSVIVDATTPGTKTNTVELLTVDQYDTDSTNNVASVPITPYIADLSLTKTVDNANPGIGNPVVFTITVRNNGPDGATGVTVLDNLPAGLTFSSSTASPPGSYDNLSDTWTIGTLADGATATLNITATAGASPIPTNFAEVETSDQLDPDSTPGNGNTTEDDHDGTPFADLNLTKTVNNAFPYLGDTVTFTIVVENNGSLDATGVQVKDLLNAAEFTYTTHNTPDGTYNDVNGLWTIGTIPRNGGTAFLEISAKVKKTGALSNTAAVCLSNQFDPDSTPGCPPPASPGEDDEARVDLTAYVSTLSVVISEVAWPGTTANSSHEWVELYNSSTNTVDITGWKLKDNSTTITFNACIPDCQLSPGEFFLIEDNDSAVSDVSAGYVTSSIALLNSGEILQLLDNTGYQIDYANKDGGAWPAGSETNYATMERVLTVVDADTAWYTNTGVVKNGKDADGNDIWGTPGKANTPTPTPTLTPTPTGTLTITPTPTATVNGPTPSTRQLYINEVAWSGTLADSTDEWIELYNPSATQAVNLTGWKLVATDGSPSIDLSGTIPASGYFVIAASSSVFNDLTPNLTFTGTLSNDGEILRLLDSSGTVVDTANSDGGGWPAGSPSPNYASMERSGSVADSSSAWFTFAGTTVVAHDKNNNAIKGTPGRANWATTVTPTRTVTSTSATVARTATRTQTPAPTATPFGRPVLNEFLPRPGYDWNQDGKVDVYDEFIEIKNIGGISVSLKDWKLDDEPDSGSAPFSLPEVTLQAGERILLYGLQTNILLSDGGDTVRLLNPAGAVFDAYTYSVVKVTDRSICRIIDGNGSWYKDCIPSPNFTNTREGVVPSMPGGSDVLSATCNLPDTLPPDFLFAECRGYGAGIWDSFFWDQFGWQGIKYLFSGRWETFVE